MAAVREQFTHDQDATLDYQALLKDWLADGETVNNIDQVESPAELTVEDTPGAGSVTNSAVNSGTLTIDSEDHSAGTVITIWVTATQNAQQGKYYTVIITFTTSQSRTEQAIFIFQIY